ncbi:MAG: acyl-CoA dehydrogenase family protein [Deltaproteobacteria bacterium]|nr:acyl-CoA dehydrogenase family protein [Deltaproteobacteria bacterium]MBW2419621.1 acyl-CoA dehydrogenase family protein [Deltaproteobacteria bacterium]
MALILSEEQQMLQQTVRAFVAERAPVAHLRALRDTQDEVGFSRALWQEMAELGWTGITLPEEFGGSGLGHAELGVLLEECGRTLMPEPFLSTLVLGAEAVRLGGSEDQKRKLLPGVCSGDSILTLAFQESGRFAPYRIATRAESSGSGHRLTGEKLFVLDGHVADHIIVVARSEGDDGSRDGLSLFMVDPSSAGVEVTRTSMVDSHNAARVKLEGVEVGADALLGEVGRGAEILDPVLDRAMVAVSAELLGCATEAFERTIAYLKIRDQFGVKIGSFQALKHRAAVMFSELELSRSSVLDALRAIDEGREELPTLASTTKARLSDTAALVTREALQMHGGIGMTDEEEVGFFLKRARAAELFLGDSSYHRDRFARLQGF